MTQNTQQSTDVVKSIFTDEWMAERVRAEGMTLTALAEQFSFEGVDVLDDKGDGVFNLELVEDKNFLVNLPFLITRWRFNTSDKFKDEEGNDGTFVSVEFAYSQVKDGPLFAGVFNDGSGTGICGQLQTITKHRQEKLEKTGEGNDPYAGRYVRRGLRRSDYMRTKTTDEGAPMLDKKGEPIQEAATSFYLNI